MLSLLPTIQYAFENASHPMVCDPLLMKIQLVLFAALLVAAASPPMNASGDNQPIGLPGGTTYALVSTGPDAGVRISINLPADLPDPGKINPVPYEATGPNGQPPELLPRFKTSFSPESAPGSLLVSVPKADELTPGQYTLKIRFEVKDTAAGLDRNKLPPPLTLTLTLTGTAQLDTPPAIVIGQEKGIFLADSPVPGKLVLHEQGKARLNFKIVDEPAASTSPWSKRGTLALSPEGVVDRGSATVVEVSPIGDYSVGASTGFLIVQSSNLAAPVNVAYTVRVRRDPVWIVVSAVGGLFLGWLVRVALKGRIAFVQARLAASRFVASLMTILQATPDTVFRAKVNAQLDALRRQARSGRDPIALIAAVTAAKAGLDVAQADLDTRSQTLKSQLDALHKLLFRQYSFPTAVEAAAQAARNGCASAEATLAGRDTANAQRQLDGDVASQLTNLGLAAGQWRADTRPYLENLQTYLPALAEAETATLKTEISAWLSAFGDFAPPPDFKAETLDPALTLTHTAHCRALNLADFLLRQGSQFVLVIGTGFVPAETDMVEDLAKSAKQQGDNLHADLEAARPDSNQPFRHQQRQKSEWLEAFAKLLPDRQNLLAIQGKLDAGQWLAAAEEVRQQRQPTTFGMAISEENGAEQTTLYALAARTPNAGRIHFRSEYAAEMNVQPAAGAVPVVLTGSAHEQAVLQQESGVYMACQTVVVGILFVVIAYKSFAADWIGDYTNFMSVFAWGFFVDLSADGVLPLFRKMISVGAPAAAEH